MYALGRDDLRAEHSDSVTVDRFRHGAYFYDGEDEFLAGTVDFIRGGVRGGEPVLVVVDARKIDLLRGELADEVESVEFLDMAQVGQNPARIIPRWREFVDENVGPGSAARGIGEPVWAGRTDAELTEGQRHEALLNLAFDGGHAWSLLCPYDVRGLDDDVLEEARRSHPILADGGGERRSGVYDRDAALHPFDGSLPEPATRPHEMRYGPGDLSAVRQFTERHALALGLDRDAVADLVLAVSELATNSVRHATGTGRVRIWRENAVLLCEIDDHGLIEDPLVGRAVPPAEALGGRGLWIVNQLCELVQVRSADAGTAIRLHMSL